MRAVNHFLSYELRADYLVIRLKFLVDFLPQLILQKNVCSGHDEPRAPTSGMFFQALSCHLNDYRVLTVLRGCTVHAVGGTSPIFRFERSRWDTLIQICTGSTLHFYTK